MKFNRQAVPVVIGEFLQPNMARKSLQIRNTNAANTLYLQTGPSPGAAADFFPILPGDVYTLDPQTANMQEMLQQAWWWFSPSGAMDVYVCVG